MRPDGFWAAWAWPGLVSSGHSCSSASADPAESAGAVSTELLFLFRLELEEVIAVGGVAETAAPSLVGVAAGPVGGVVKWYPVRTSGPAGPWLLCPHAVREGTVGAGHNCDRAGTEGAGYGVPGSVGVIATCTSVCGVAEPADVFSWPDT